MYQDLEDIHNSVFLSLIENDYKKLRQYKGINGCTVSSWIMIITTNTTLNFIKRNKDSISLDDRSDSEERTFKDTIPDPQPSVIEQIKESEKAELLRELIEGLSPNDKLFLKYCFEDELQPEEIAGIINLSVSAIYSKKSRIIDKLQKIAKKKNLLQEI
jgi:RNA polymerase sigma factor (sigma-70 family)